MPNGEVATGVNSSVAFLRGLQRGRAMREQLQRRQRMQELMGQAIQENQGQMGFSIDPNTGMITRIAPTRQTTPTTGYSSPAQRNLRLAYGLEQPTTQELVPFAPSGYPTTEGGYVLPTPGQPAEYLPGYEPRPIMEAAPTFFEREFAEPTRERIEAAGFEPSITGFKRKETAKLPGIKTETEKKQTKATLFREYTLSLAPKLNIQSYVDKYDKQAPTQILKTLRKSNTDFLRWIESTYGEDLAKQLFPEQYLQRR